MHCFWSLSVTGTVRSVGLGPDASCESLNFLRHHCYSDTYLTRLGESNIRKHLPRYTTYNTPPVKGFLLVWEDLNIIVIKFVVSHSLFSLEFHIL